MAFVFQVSTNVSKNRDDTATTKDLSRLKINLFVFIGSFCVGVTVAFLMILKSRLIVVGFTFYDLYLIFKNKQKREINKKQFLIDWRSLEYIQFDVKSQTSNENAVSTAI